LTDESSNLEAKRAKSNQWMPAPQAQDKGLNAKNNDLSRIDLAWELI
jgi:hypothetical protein